MIVNGASWIKVFYINFHFSLIKTINHKVSITAYVLVPIISVIKKVANLNLKTKSIINLFCQLSIFLKSFKLVRINKVLSF